MKYHIKVRANGSMEFLGSPPEGFPVIVKSKERFSEITPVNPVLKILFRILRWCFGEEGYAATWTRNWLCQWEGIILQGPARGRRKRSEFREELVEWEQNLWREPWYYGLRDGT